MTKFWLSNTPPPPPIKKSFNFKYLFSYSIHTRSVKSLQKAKSNESGRSMVEMLGVLAIVGMLSIGSFAALKYALNRARAVNLLDEARRRAVVVMTQIGLQSQEPNLSEFVSNVTPNGTFDTAVVRDNNLNRFALKVSGVKADVCKHILTTIDENSALRRLAAESDLNAAISTCDSPEGDYLMVYNADMGTVDPVNTCRLDSDCRTACATCQIEDGAESGTCINECEVTENECTSNEQCTEFCAGCIIPDGAEKGTCQYACESVEYLESTGEQWINTGYSLSNPSDFYIDIKAQLMGSQNWSGLWGAYNGYRSGYFFTADDPYRLETAIGDGPACEFSDQEDIKNNPITYRLYIDTSAQKQIVIADGTTVCDETYEGPVNPEPISIFGVYKGFTTDELTAMRLYFFRYVVDGSVVRDYVPVLDPDGVPALLDRIEPKLYYNQGSGEFRTNKDTSN